MEILEKLDKINYLYDIYGELLSEKQREVLEMYYLDDYSLGEIAGHYQVSRQAIHDMLKRAVEYLEHLEENLKLRREYLSRREKLKEAREITARLAEGKNCSLIELNRLKELLDELHRENEGEVSGIARQQE